jgi:UDP-glucose 4-epimerase
MTTPASPTQTSPLRFLVVGGVDYIGSHMVKHLLRRGCNVVTFDKLSTGRRDAELGSAPSRLVAHSATARQALWGGLTHLTSRTLLKTSGSEK